MIKRRLEYILRRYYIAIALFHSFVSLVATQLPFLVLAGIAATASDA
jgi:hypothetical protein